MAWEVDIGLGASVGKLVKRGGETDCWTAGTGPGADAGAGEEGRGGDPTAECPK